MSTPSVADLQSQITALQSEKQTLTTQLAEANTAKSDLQTKLTASEQKVTDLTGKLTVAEKDRDTFKQRAGDLEKEAKTAEQRAQEISAANGVPPASKQAAGTIPGNQHGASDGKAHYDAYQKAMSEGRGMDAAQLWKEHQKSIEAHVATLGPDAAR